MRLFLLLALASQAAAQTTRLKLNLGDSCSLLEPRRSWTCERAERCVDRQAVLSFKPPLCGFLGNNPLICCPPASKAARMCEAYQEEVCVVACEKSNDCQQYSPSNRLKGGTVARPRDHVHMALIGWGESLEDVDWRCGGSLVSDRWVLSAAHCAVSSCQDSSSCRNGGPAWVRLGELDLASTTDDASTQDYLVVERRLHPQYNPPALYHDLALLKLDRSVSFSQYVRPACLNEVTTLSNTKALATGWGRTGLAEVTSDQLLEVELDLLDDASCAAAWGNTSALAPLGIGQGMLCAGVPDGSKAVRQGDSGGPLVIKERYLCLKTLVGVTSFSRALSTDIVPSVFSRVSSYVPWIEEVVWPDENPVYTWLDTLYPTPPDVSPHPTDASSETTRLTEDRLGQSQVDKAPSQVTEENQVNQSVSLVTEENQVNQSTSVVTEENHVNQSPSLVTEKNQVDQSAVLPPLTWYHPAMEPPPAIYNQLTQPSKGAMPDKNKYCHFLNKLAKQFQSQQQHDFCQLLNDTWDPR